MSSVIPLVNMFVSLKGEEIHRNKQSFVALTLWAVFVVAVLGFCDVGGTLCSVVLWLHKNLKIHCLFRNSVVFCIMQ